MNLAVDLCEHVPYSAPLAATTWTAKRSAYIARPPEASPVENVKIERDARMRTLLVQSIVEASERGVAPKPAAIENFDALLQLLPAELPITDPYVTDAGSISLDWDDEPSAQFALLLKDGGQIAFAAYFSGEKVNGSTRFSGLQLPESLLDAAHRWSREVRERV